MQRHKHPAPALGDCASCAQPCLPTKVVKSSPAQPEATATCPAGAACCGNNPSRTWRAVFSSVCKNLTILHQESNHLQGSPSQPGQDLAEQASSATGKDEITAPSEDRTHLALASVEHCARRPFEMAFSLHVRLAPLLGSSKCSGRKKTSCHDVHDLNTAGAQPPSGDNLMRLSMPGLRSLWQALRGLCEHKVLTSTSRSSCVF